MSVETKGKLSKDKKYYIHSVIGLILMFGVGFLPPFSTITPLGMKYLGILLGLVYLWSLVGMFWPSLMGLIAMIIFGENSAAVCTSSFGNSLVIMCVFAMAVIFAVAQTGVFDYLVRWIITRKIIEGRPWLLTGALILGLYIIVALGGEMPLLFVMWEMVYKIAETAGIPRKSKYCAAMVVGLMFAFVCGMISLPYKAAFVAVMGFFYGMTPMTEINIVSASVLLVCGCTAALVLFILMMKFVLRIDLSALKNADAALAFKDLPPMNKRQKFAGIYLIVFLVMMMLTGLVSFLGDNAFVQTYSRFGTLGVSWLLTAIMVLVKIDGKPMMDVSKTASMIVWDSVLLMAIAFTFSPMLTDEATGISAWVMSLVNPILGGHSAFTFTVIVFVITLILTNFANNTVVMMLMIAVIMPYSQTLGLNLHMMAVLMCLMAQTAFLLPASSIYGALIYSQAEHISSRYIMMAAVIAMVAATLAMLLVFMPLGNVLF